MDDIKKAKDKLTKLLEKVTDKESIDAISEVTSELDKAEEKHTKLETENKELLEDYRKAVKNAASSKTDEENGKQEDKEFSFEGFAEEYIQKNYKEGE